MLKFLKQNYTNIKRGFSTDADILLCQCLKERSLIRISGNDSDNYLQGLVTNDMNHLQGAASMFAMFLNSKGRVLYDSIIYNSKNQNTFYIECDTNVSANLQDHLKMYKVRRKLSIDCLKDELDIWTVVTENNFKNLNSCDYKKILDVIKQKLPDLVAVIDPRLMNLGIRIITPKNFNLSNEIKSADMPAQEQNFYKLLRYKLGVGEGVEELPMEKCIPMEANGDYLHGISFHKGCYIGQELTARTYHTGVIRKRLMPLVFDEELNVKNGIPIFAVPELSKNIGKVQGIEKINGVGLLRIEEALKAKELVVSDVKCKTHRPFWWPSEAPKERMKTA